MGGFQGLQSMLEKETELSSMSQTMQNITCPFIDTFAMEVESGKTYLLRIINAALNDDLFFAISGHNMMLVEVDAIAPGQTTNVLVRAKCLAGRYFMAARPFMDAPLPADNKTATAILQYKGIPNIVLPTRPQLPASNDTDFALSYNKKLRSLNSAKFPAIVPLKVDRKLFYTVGFGKDLCTTCVKGTRLLASLNNISFVMPKIGLLQAHYFNTKRVFRTDFPDKPPKPFNYTGAPLTADLGTAHMGQG
ncbi:laccase-11-like [Gossypium arboreum]|uniref:laccase-11-like n=1 Tax=Gossypium arboreum TaxID=29729 RepID=UPI00081911DB|nr:laccase-11-like [Gossypium arboreum]